MNHRLALAALGGLICLTPMVRADESQELHQAFRHAAEKAGSVGRQLQPRQGPSILPSDNRSLGIIYPGEGIGRITIGTRMRDALDALGWGKPDRLGKDAATKDLVLVYEHNRGVEFIFSKQEKEGHLSDSILKMIVIRNPSFIVFGNGLGVGQRWPYRDGGDQCEITGRDASRLAVVCKGISFITNRETGTIEAIEVFRP